MANKRTVSEILFLVRELARRADSYSDDLYVSSEETTALYEVADMIEQLTFERDAWADKWHKIRAELAEFKFPGMKGIIRST